MKCNHQVIALMLLLLMPLQVFAASNMTICNSMMQMTATAEHANTQMPCHDLMAGVSQTAGSSMDSTSNSDVVSKSYCASMCASLNVLSILHNDLYLIDDSASSSVISIPSQSYISVVQSNLLRPPIFLI